MLIVQDRQILVKVFTISLLLLVAFWGSAFDALAQGDPSQDNSLIIRRFLVQGNVEVSTEQILAQVQESKIGQPLNRDSVQADVQRIADLGFFENVEAIPAVSNEGVDLTFIVYEFPVIDKFSVTVRENVVSQADVRKLFSVEEGVILNANVFSEELDYLPLRSGEILGYVLHPVSLDFRGPSGNELHIELAPVRVGKIIIEGNDKTQDVVILREIPIQEGDILSMDQVRTGLLRLGQLGFFEPIIPEFLMTSDPLVVDLLFPIVEARTGRAAFGGGYSSVDGLVGYIEVADENFLGRGTRAQVKWEFGSKKNTYDVGLYEPYLFGTQTSAGFNLYNMMNRRETYQGNEAYPYTVNRVGGDVTFGRPLGTFTRGFLTLKAENASQSPDTEDSVVPELDSKTRSIRFNARTDTTDHLFFPTLGFRHDLSVETASRIFGGDTEFTKYQTSYSRYFKAGSNNQTWAFRALLGYGVGEIPLIEQFQVGGPDSVRGYRYGEASGDRMFVFQGEYRFPINEQIQGVLFADAGNAWVQQPIDLRDLKAGVGLGLRFSTPIGMMRIDYGWGKDGGHAYFSLGPSF